MKMIAEQERGAVLVLALLVSAVLSIMTASVLLIARQHINAASNLTEINQQGTQNESCAEVLMAELSAADAAGQRIDIVNLDSPNKREIHINGEMRVTTARPEQGCLVTIQEAPGPARGSNVATSTTYGVNALAGKIFQYKVLAKPIDPESNSALEIHLELRR